MTANIATVQGLDRAFNSGRSNLHSAELINVAFSPEEQYRCLYEPRQSHSSSCSSRLLELRC